MKRNALLLIAFALIFPLFVACDGNTMKPDTPTNTIAMLGVSIDGNNYERFNKLFSEKRKDVASKDMLKELNDLSTEASLNTHYEVIEYSNGEMLLVRLNYRQEKGEYEVEDIVKIPKEMKKLFITE